MKANGAIRKDLIRLQNSINECLDDLAIARDRKDDGEELIALRRMEALLEDVKQTCISVLFSLKEEPVSEELEEEIQKTIHNHFFDLNGIAIVGTSAYATVDDMVYIAKHFAKWQKEQFEKNRLAHFDELTSEQAQIESDFVTQHLKKNNRTPTFIDAIEHGMRLQMEQMMAKAKGGTVQKDYQIIMDDGTYIDLDPSMQLKPAFNVNANDKVKVIVTKE